MVTSFLPSYFSLQTYRKLSELALSFSWLLGLFTGSILAFREDYLFSLWMRTAEFGSMSIVCLFISLLLPFLFSAIAVIFQQRWLILFFAFCKALLFGFCVCGIFVCCRSAGWLVCLLLFFSEFFLLPWLFFFMMRCLHGDSAFRMELLFILVLAFLIVSVDRCVISPFLASLI